MQKLPTSLGSGPQNFVGEIFNSDVVSSTESVSPSKTGYGLLQFNFGIFIVAIAE